MYTRAIYQELGYRFDRFEQAITEKLDHLAELQRHEVQTGQPYVPLGTGSIGLVPWILLTVLTTTSAICWLVVWFAPNMR